MKTEILGIHHITAIAGNAQKNHDFYTRVLGLRLIKKTVTLMIRILITFITVMKTATRAAS